MDEKTLNAAANLHDVNILVVSTFDPGAAHTFQPVSSNASAFIYLSI